MLRVLGWLFGIGALIAIAAVGLGFHLQQRFEAEPAAVAAVIVDIPRGASFNQVVSRLKAVGLQGEPWQWRLLAERLDLRQSLRAGEYEIDAGATPAAVLAQLAEGRVKHYYFTIIEGWTLAELRAALAANRVLAAATAGMDNAALAAAVGHSSAALEGWFAPETYRYVRGDRDLDLLLRAYQRQRRLVEEAWGQLPVGGVLASPEALLTLASIVEKETAVAAERPRVAQVFLRRLAIGMRLQTDPTIIYGLGSAFDGNLRRVHLDDPGNPYNTYQHGGLPPTPIALPGAAAIAAVVNPASTTDLYFVARGDGSHVFSKTYDEHRRAVDKYQRRR